MIVWLLWFVYLWIGCLWKCALLKISRSSLFHGVVFQLPISFNVLFFTFHFFHFLTHPLLCSVTFRRTIFETLHGLAHPVVKASVTLIASRFSWRGLAKDVRVWVRSCVACRRAKVHEHTKACILKHHIFKKKFEKFAIISKYYKNSSDFTISFYLP